MRVRRAAAVVVLAAAALVSGTSSAGRAAAPRPLVAFASIGRAPVLVHVEPDTFRRVGKRQLEVEGYGSDWSLSPDRSLLVLGTDRRRFVFVDAVRLRRLGELRVSLPANIAASAWFGRRVVLVSQSPSGRVFYVRTVDVRTRRVESLRTIDGALQAVGRTAESLVLLLGPDDGVGPARLDVVPPAGPVRSIALEAIPAGWNLEEDPREPRVHAQATPALAVDPAGRAFVVGGGTPVAVVDLRTGAVAYRSLPAAAPSDRIAKGGSDGPYRSARWIGDGAFVLSGRDDHGWIDAQGQPQTRQTPAGALLVETRTWTSRVLDGAGTAVQPAGSALVVESTLWDSTAPRSTGNGLVAYGRDGGRRYHLFPGGLAWAQAVGNRLIVGRPPGESYVVVDAETGRRLRSARTTPPFVLQSG